MSAPPIGHILQGDCIGRMRAMQSHSVDFILTDPPYVARYRSRDGRKVANDDNADWLRPAFAEMYRVLKYRSFCISFYGWPKADLFIAAWRAAGFRPVGHIMFRKRYASSVRFLRYQHEAAYLLAKGDVNPPAAPISDVLDWSYTGKPEAARTGVRGAMVAIRLRTRKDRRRDHDPDQFRVSPSTSEARMTRSARSSRRSPSWSAWTTSRTS